MISDKYLTQYCLGKYVEAFLVDNGKSIGIKGTLVSFDETTMHLENPDLGDSLLERDAIKSIGVRKASFAPKLDLDNIGNTSFALATRQPRRGNGS